MDHFYYKFYALLTASCQLMLKNGKQPHKKWPYLPTLETF
ncbi:hypothetical protein SLEP1_g58752 [Rubroshorea leprosula]|uniref:Uncharacterized protein n=1 Tax=Rubroshorea leprosula TaxID=152421 RepID=A0AAV5MQC8_9ROSI|nr:hypothetical protein SLEP1_g58752 [Rubroshorea leprosula]